MDVAERTLLLVPDEAWGGQADAFLDRLSREGWEVLLAADSAELQALPQGTPSVLGVTSFTKIPCTVPGPLLLIAEAGEEPRCAEVLGNGQSLYCMRDDQGAWIRVAPELLRCLCQESTGPAEIPAEHRRPLRNGVQAVGEALLHTLGNTLTGAMLAIPVIRDRLEDPLDRRILESVETEASRSVELVRQLSWLLRVPEGALSLVAVASAVERTVRAEASEDPRVELRIARETPPRPVLAAAVEVFDAIYGMTAAALRGCDRETVTLEVGGDEEASWIALEAKGVEEWSPSRVEVSAARRVAERGGGRLEMPVFRDEAPSIRLIFPFDRLAKNGSGTATPASNGENRPILVDGFPADQWELCRHALEGAGHRVIRAATPEGGSGRDLKEEVLAAAVLCTGPGLKGILAGLRFHRRRPDVPLVICRSAGRPVGATFASRVLSMPFSPAELVGTVRAAMKPTHVG